MLMEPIHLLLLIGGFIALMLVTDGLLHLVLCLRPRSRSQARRQR
jgi:hypothetical protein